MIHSPAVAKSRRRSWREIHDYYQKAVEYTGLEELRGLLDFSCTAEKRPHLQSLVTVGSLGCIFVFRDTDCVEEKGYIVIGDDGLHGDGKIIVVYQEKPGCGPAMRATFSDVASALSYFETCLADHGFMGKVGT